MLGGIICHVGSGGGVSICYGCLSLAHNHHHHYNQHHNITPTIISTTINTNRTLKYINPTTIRIFTITQLVPESAGNFVILLFYFKCKYCKANNEFKTNIFFKSPWLLDNKSHSKFIV